MSCSSAKSNVFVRTPGRLHLCTATEFGASRFRYPLRFFVRTVAVANWCGCTVTYSCGGHKVSHRHVFSRGTCIPDFRQGRAPLAAEIRPSVRPTSLSCKPFPLLKTCVSSFMTFMFRKDGKHVGRVKPVQMQDQTMLALSD